MKKIRLYTPGPCAVPEEVLLEMARPFEHHRTDWFKGYMKQATEKLKVVLQTKNDVLIITGSGTAAAEGAIVACHPPGSKLLTIEGGKFGQHRDNGLPFFLAGQTLVSKQFIHRQAHSDSTGIPDSVFRLLDQLFQESHPVLEWSAILVSPVVVPGQ